MKMTLCVDCGFLCEKFRFFKCEQTKAVLRASLYCIDTQPLWFRKLHSCKQWHILLCASLSHDDPGEHCYILRGRQVY